MSKAQVATGTQLSIGFDGLNAFEFSPVNYNLTDGAHSFKIRVNPIPTGGFAINTTPTKSGVVGEVLNFIGGGTLSFDLNNDGTFGGAGDEFTLVSMNVGGNRIDPGITESTTISPDGGSTGVVTITSTQTVLNSLVIASPNNAVVSGSFTAADFNGIKSLKIDGVPVGGGLAPNPLVDNMVIIVGAVENAPTTATVAASVFLEGAYNGTDLNTTLNASIPTTQPYSINGHSGGTASGIPANAVDWVLIELREAGSAATALSNTKVGSVAGFLMNDGSVKATDGTSNLTVPLSGNTGSEFFMVIYHRNHLPIMSANAVSESSGTYTIDFTTVSANTYQATTALVTLSSGKFAMLAGDADGDGDVDEVDLTTWRSQNGLTFNYSGNGRNDLNLDGVINAVDRNDFQQKNTSKTSQVPNT
ncbi:MAG: hypothetical protein HEP71_33605 [Roseivirga sp.]|nr:hypothetical protein [Roseivirga sp.]